MNSNKKPGARTPGQSPKAFVKTDSFYQPRPAGAIQNVNFARQVADFCEATGQPHWFCVELLDYLERRHKPKFGEKPA